MRPRGAGGAAAGVLTVLLFVIGALLVGQRPSFAAGGADFAAYLDDHRTRVQLACLFFAAAAPCLVWFLATFSALAGTDAPGARGAAGVAYGCGVAFTAVFLVDVTALAVAALRPGNMAQIPELAAALQDFELLAMSLAAPLASGFLGAIAVLILRYRALSPTWVGSLAALASAAYALRLGTLFTTEGPFAADGLLGLYVPVGALLAWLLVSSGALVRTIPDEVALSDRPRIPSR
jgi:hypothetical protein